MFHRNQYSTVIPCLQSHFHPIAPNMPLPGPYRSSLTYIFSTLPACSIRARAINLIDILRRCLDQTSSQPEAIEDRQWGRRNIIKSLKFTKNIIQNCQTLCNFNTPPCSTFDIRVLYYALCDIGDCTTLSFHFIITGEFHNFNCRKLK